MLSLTRKTDYALIALSLLTQRRAEGDAKGVSARVIADQHGLPLPLLMNILKELAHAGIVRSTRGAQGGYSLAVDPHELSIRRIVTVMEGPVRMTECGDAYPRLPIVGQGCGLEANCPIREPMRRLNERISAFLDEVTLADLLESRVDVPAERVGVPTIGAASLD